LSNFAFGVDPTLLNFKALSYNGSVIVPGEATSAMIAGAPVVEFVRLVDRVAAGLTYSVEFSANLTTWQTVATAPQVLATDGTNEVVSLAFPMLAGGVQAKFCKVKVSLDP
jgi:hypothetical protein